MQTLSLLIAAVAASAASATPSSPGVLLEFSATWCEPCQKISPLVRRLKRQGFPIRKVDVDREPDLARRFGIRSIPAFVLVVNGKEVARRVGPQSENELKRLMARIPQSAPQPKSAAVRNQQRRGNPASSRNSTSNVATAEAPRKGILPRFRFPLFGAKSKEKSGKPAADVPPIIRAKYDSRRKMDEKAVRFDPFAASIRIRVKDNSGVSYGSGTIVHSKTGRTIVLTCGHIFRDLKPESQIEVDVYGGKQPETYVGKVLDYDLKADVGLIVIASDLPLPASKVAAADYRVSTNDSVLSIGCGGGEPPSRQQIKVTALNRYFGPDTVECTGVPDTGRSGGGLFNADGNVIGVCFAADSQDQRGLYAGLKPIHALLNRAGLAPLDRSHKNDPSRLQQPADKQPILVADENDTDESGTDEKKIGEKNIVAPVSSVVAAQASHSVTAVPKGSEEAEVICIIRTLNDPRAASRVVIINRASPKFLSYLRGELKQQPQPTSTQTFTSDKRQPARLSVTPQTMNKPRSEIVSRPQSGWRPVKAAKPQAEKFVVPSAPQRYRRSAASRR